MNLDWIRPVNCFINLGSGRIWTELLEKNCDVFVTKKRYFVNILDFMWNWIFNFLTFLGNGWTWTEFKKFRTGSEPQNMTVRSSLVAMDPECQRVDSGRILLFLSDPESKFCEKPGPDLEPLFNFDSNRTPPRGFLSINMGKFSVGLIAAGVWTRDVNRTMRGAVLENFAAYQPRRVTFRSVRPAPRTVWTFNDEPLQNEETFLKLLS